MAKKKINTVLSLSPEIKEMAQKDSIEILGSENLTGYVTYLINKENKNKAEKQYQEKDMDSAYDKGYEDGRKGIYG